jgi:methoxymalonate biosynthesis acyl carrier protein
MSIRADLTALELQLREFIAGELIAGESAESIGPEDDLIKRGIVDSLGVTQLVDFCESNYGIRVTNEDLVLDNFRTVRHLADFVERTRSTRQGRLRFVSRRR